MDLRINFFAKNTGCCIFVNFTSLYNSGLNGRLAFVVGLVMSLKHLYGESIVNKGSKTGNSAEYRTKWRDLDHVIKLI